MYRSRSIQSSLSLKDKILSIDYILVCSIFILGLVSILAMYSTDGGEFKYHTNSHILRFFVFFFASIVKFSPPNWIILSKFKKNMTEIAKNSMIFGGCLSHEFPIFGKFFCIDVLNALLWGLTIWVWR